MNKKILLVLMLTFSAGYADLTSGVFGLEEMIQVDRCCKRPFRIQGSYDAIGSSKFCDRPFKNECQRFRIGQGKLGYLFCYKGCYQEGVLASVGYTHTNFHWEHNPFFDQKNFAYVNFELAAVTKRFRRWTWQANFAMNVDTRHFQVEDYTNYNLMLWGRYDWSPCVHFHAGFIGFTGMKVDKVYPIIGFDWCINRKWKLNAVFPMNISLVYAFNCNWSAALASRFFFERYRVDKKEYYPQGIFEYRNAGLELAINYDYCSRIRVNLHGGTTVGGQIRVSNCDHDHKQHLDIGAAPYAGFEAKIRF